MKSILALLLFAFSVLAFTSHARANDDITFFDGQGNASAYIALNEKLTIYLWNGKPTAYLESDSAGGFHVYGFNGKHLGWFVAGVAHDHEGNAACAVKNRLQTTQFEPFKDFKEFKPFKAFKEFAPFRPFFSTSWGDTPCRLFLAEGEA